ncbi:arsenic resistance protein [Tersicoccus solisilvae]|uniref:Arsenic resistance protein n=1 Tax=Tersicoccus solisilvae TaxID=1882339 RepID=A0ABQ1NTK0_9MICC|nr:arsenic resistance protein [Tersicoccus solisilvae]GGC84426.1 arsenic resistance protein [Tersicoccus solisilvae]
MTGRAWMERHQVALYLGSIAVGAAAGLLIPGTAVPAEAMILPVLALLLYATFLAVPVARIGAALADRRFLVTVLAVNFVAVPVVALALSTILAGRPALLLGALVVLLAPCIDYVIVFTGLAGGAADRLVASTPVLMLVQLLAVPAVLALAVGPGVLGLLDLGPFLTAFLALIALPLAAAWLTQAARERDVRAAAVLLDGGAAAMVPLMMATLAVVVASQITRAVSRPTTVLLAVPVFVLFAVLMVAVGVVAGRVARLDVAGRRAVVLTGVTRNSLVVLPITLGLPGEMAVVPGIVVTQTLVELIVLVILVRLVPRLIPEQRRGGVHDGSWAGR